MRRIGSILSRAPAAALLMLACSGAQEHAAVASEPERCVQARELRRQAAELYTEGKLDRARRTLDAANSGCADEAASSFGLELETLIELGLEREASALAREILRSRETSAGEATRARAWLAAPREEQPASGAQLLAAGLAKKAAGDLAAAQKLFDRARVTLEAKAGTAAVLEPKRGAWNVSAMSWAPDGNTLVLAADGLLRSLRTDGYQETSRVHTGSVSVTSMAFSPDGRSLALGVGEGDAVLWDVQAARQVGKLESDVPGALRTLVFSPDGALLAGRSWEDSGVPLWSVASGQLLPLLQPVRDGVALCGVRGGSKGPGFWPAMLAFSPDGQRLLGTCAQSLGVWPLGAGQSGLAKALKGAKADEFYSVAYHPDGRHAVAGTESGFVVAFDVSAGRRLAALEAHQFNPLVGFSLDGERVLSAAVDGVVRSFSFAGGVLKPMGLYRAPLPFVDALAIHPDATQAALAGGGALVVGDATGEVTQAIRAPLGVSSLAVDRHVTRLAFGTNAGAVGVLDVAGGSIRWLQGHTKAVSALAFSPDGASLASVARDKMARIWDVKSGHGRLALPHAAALNTVAYRQDGQALVTAGDAGFVHVWEPTSGKQTRQLEGSSCAIATLSYSPDGSLLVANATDQALLRWDARTYAEAESPTRAPPQPASACAAELRPSANSLAFSSDGELLASAPSGHGIELWSWRTGERRGSLTDGGSEFHATSIAQSPRDPIAVAAGPLSARAWRLPEQTEVALATPPGGVESFVFSADGRFLFGATRRGAVAVWSVAKGGTELKLAFTLELLGEESALAQSAEGDVQWLGPKASAACVLGARVYPLELCEERFTAPGLVARLLSSE